MAQTKQEHKEAQKAYYWKNKARITAAANATNAAKRVWLSELKVAAGCIRCGYAGCAAALEFHHRDPTAKTISVGRALARSKAFLEAEIAKCDVLCANCHAELHWQ